MSRAFANQTFHCSYGTIVAGAEYDSEDNLVEEFPMFFNVETEETKLLIPVDNYKDQSLKDLRELARDRDLQITGSKDEVISRLRGWDRDQLVNRES